jgi:hypothetical protein
MRSSPFATGICSFARIVGDLGLCTSLAFTGFSFGCGESPACLSLIAHDRGKVSDGVNEQMKRRAACCDPINTVPNSRRWLKERIF